jgi:hypothetical protein
MRADPAVYVLEVPVDDPGDKPGPAARQVDAADLLYAALRLGGLFPSVPAFSAAVPAACCQEDRPTWHP